MATTTQRNRTATPEIKVKVKVKVKPAKGVDRSAHHDDNPGFPSNPRAGQSPAPAAYAATPYKHTLSVAQPHGFGHSGAQRAGPFRMSGVKGAHRIGKR